MEDRTGGGGGNCLFCVKDGCGSPGLRCCPLSLSVQALDGFYFDRGGGVAGFAGGVRLARSRERERERERQW